MFCILLYGNEVWPVKEGDVIRLEKNDVKMVRWMFNVDWLGLMMRFPQRD